MNSFDRRRKVTLLPTEFTKISVVKLNTSDIKMEIKLTLKLEIKLVGKHNGGMFLALKWGKIKE